MGFRPTLAQLFGATVLGMAAVVAISLGLVVESSRRSIMRSLFSARLGRHFHRGVEMRRLLIVTMLSTPALAEPRRAVSGAQRVSVLELYTSEGCSSCPPVDELVNGLAGDRILPLAFHVDYWDEIGWPDPFAKRRWSDRQRERANGILYTPELMLDGREIRARQLEPRDERATAKVELELDGTRATVRASGGDRVYLAITESSLAVDVKAGENRGRRLRHDHVVRELYGPLSASRPVTVELAIGREWNAASLAVTAFVEGPGHEILQAVRLPLRASP